MPRHSSALSAVVDYSHSVPTRILDVVDWGRIAGVVERGSALRFVGQIPKGQSHCCMILSRLHSQNLAEERCRMVVG